MKSSNLLKRHIQIAVSSTLLTLGMLAYASVLAAPIASPPNGNPSFPKGPTGDQGPAGQNGGQGPQGITGDWGPQGVQGRQGIGFCSWYQGNFWITHGWDNTCAWEVGAIFYCLSGRLVGVYQDKDGVNNNTNCNAVYHGHSSHP